MVLECLTRVKANVSNYQQTDRGSNTSNRGLDRSSKPRPVEERNEDWPPFCFAAGALKYRKSRVLRQTGSSTHNKPPSKAIDPTVPFQSHCIV